MYSENYKDKLIDIVNQTQIEAILKKSIIYSKERDKMASDQLPSLSPATINEVSQSRFYNVIITLKSDCHFFICLMKALQK